MGPKAATRAMPRILVAALAGDCGKTLVACGLLAVWRAQGLSPAAFKKGPDYIDPAWLSLAAGGGDVVDGLPAASCRNLDTYLQGTEGALASFCRHASSTVSVIEGNRGLLDGLDADGTTHSTAALARLLRAPVVLVLRASKATRTLAAPVVGCRRLEPELQLAGVILSGVTGARHEAEARRAVEELAGVPVVGVLPLLREPVLPARHLGLVPPQEQPRAEELRQQLAQLVARHVDHRRLLDVARAAPDLAEAPPLDGPAAARVRVGVFSDSAFTFYYPENLEALRRAGAELVAISALVDRELPAVDALYLGGGFPETHAAPLAGNVELLRQVREAASRRLPIYAECGGLIYLARELRCDGKRYAMAGVLPLELELDDRPQGHGYVEAIVEEGNPFFAAGTTLRGHEFHYTRVAGAMEARTTLRLARGVGCGGGHDGVVVDNVCASYTHLHAEGTPRWAPALVELAVAARRGFVRDQ
jgi:cobyrinic acid a,c-diamide synthase